MEKNTLIPGSGFLPHSTKNLLDSRARNIRGNHSPQANMVVNVLFVLYQLYYRFCDSSRCKIPNAIAFGIFLK